MKQETIILMDNQDFDYNEVWMSRQDQIILFRYFYILFVYTMRNDTSSPVLLLKKYIKSLSRFFVRIFQSIYSRIMVMDKYEQVFVV